MEQVIKKERKTKEKIVLTQDNAEKLNAWKSHFEKWNDIIVVTNSDLVNFILTERSEALSVDDVKTLLKNLVNRSEGPKVRKPRQKKINLQVKRISSNIN